MKLPLLHPMLITMLCWGLVRELDDAVSVFLFLDRGPSPVVGLVLAFRVLVDSSLFDSVVLPSPSPPHLGPLGPIEILFWTLGCESSPGHLIMSCEFSQHSSLRVS